MNHNARALQHIFNIGCSPDRAEDYCCAIQELRAITRQRENNAQHVYVMAGDENEPYPGALCFAFQEEVPEGRLSTLRLLCDQFFRFLRTHDKSEFHRRSAVLANQIAGTHSEIHSLRNTLGALGNKLQTNRHRQPNIGIAASIACLEDALELHAHALQCLDRLEMLTTFTPERSGPTISLDDLVKLWLRQWKQPDDAITVTLVHRQQANVRIELMGPPEDLGEALFQFIEAPLRNLQTTTVPANAMPPYLWILIDENQSELHLLFTVFGTPPPHVIQAVHDVTILSRLPSAKPSGGRGLLTAISTVRNRYNGRIELQNAGTMGTRWDVRIPVTVLEQYRLF